MRHYWTLKVEDVVSKFINLHQKLGIIPSIASYEKVIMHCCNSCKVHPLATFSVICSNIPCHIILVKKLEHFDKIRQLGQNLRPLCLPIMLLLLSYILLLTICFNNMLAFDHWSYRIWQGFSIQSMKIEHILDSFFLLIMCYVDPCRG